MNVKEFRQEMEKQALVGSVLIGGLTAMGIKEEAAENRKKYGIKPRGMSGSTTLSSPYKYEFGGSNRVKRVGKSPHSLY